MSPSVNLAPHASGIVSHWRRQSNFYRVIAPPQFPRHGMQHNGIQSTAEAMVVVTTFHPHLLCWGAVPVRHRCRDVRTAGPGAWHLRHGLYVGTSPMLHSQISLTEPPTVCMVCDTIDQGLSFLYANSSAWDPPALVVRLISRRSSSRQHVDLRTSEPCKALTLELTVAAESLAKTSEVDVYEFDCSEDDGFCASMEVLSFPTIRIFDHREWTRYRGAPKASSYVPGLATV